jgi:hypothetical protein
MNEESKTQLHQLLMQWYEKGANDAEAALKEALEYGIDIAIKAEREACAKLCEERERANLYGVKECAAAIRGRTE